MFGDHVELGGDWEESRIGTGTIWGRYGEEPVMPEGLAPNVKFNDTTGMGLASSADLTLCLKRSPSGEL